MEVNYSFVTRQDILNFPFPHKLWLVVNLEFCDFLRWNRDGTVILLDLVTLEDYLNSTTSIFKIKNISVFLKHLQEFNFERLNSTPEDEEDLLLQYKNENFQRYRLDLLGKIRRQVYHMFDQPSTQIEGNSSRLEQYTSIQKHVSERMMGDLCFMFHGSLSKIKKSRLRFQTILSFNNEKRILKAKLNASESIQYCKSKLDKEIEDQVIELPAELFENPHDSVLNWSQEYLPAYAGYYGNCSYDQIIHFFGEYLPKYEDGSFEVKKIVTDTNTETLNNSLLNNAETIAIQDYSPITTADPNVILSTPIEPNNMYNFNFSPNLEPIFINNENSENICASDFNVTQLNSNTLNNANSMLTSNYLNNEEDISMEEFLKFENPSKGKISTNIQKISNVPDGSFDREERGIETLFPQMPTSYKMELNDDVKENEENFRNFFIQYRASLNLLYDRQ